MPRALLAAVLVLTAAAVAWTRPTPPPLSLTQVQRLLPAGGTMHSLARLDMDGRAPQEVAVVAIVPRHPGARDIVYYSAVFAYDRWHRQFTRIYEALLPSTPISVDAGRLLGHRDAAVFAAVLPDGTWSYRVVGSVHGRVAVVHEGRVKGRTFIADPFLIEEGERPRVLIWEGRRFGERPHVDFTPAPSRTWRYGLRNGKVVASTSMVRLVPRQILHVARAGGGPSTSVIPDVRLDVVEGGGYRTRAPGIYTIRVASPFVPGDAAYVLTLVVNAPDAP